MAIDLPSAPWPDVANPRDLDFGVTQTPPAGGVTRRYDRLGSRHAVDFVMPNMTGACASAWLARRDKAKATGQTVRCAYPLIVPQSALPAAIVVDGAGQTGRTLNVKGLPSSVAERLPAYAAFSLIVDGRSYLYRLTDAVAAGAGATATLQLDCMLRASPADEAALLFTAPIIEGWLRGAEGWTWDKLVVGGLNYSVEEAA